MKKIIITEDQLKKYLQTEGVNKINIKNFTQEIKDEFRCEGKHGGSDFKSAIYDKLKDYGFRDLSIKFFKKDEYHNLYYFVHTEKVIFVVKVESDINNDKPCIRVVDIEYFINYKND